MRSVRAKWVAQTVESFAEEEALLDALPAEDDPATPLSILHIQVSVRHGALNAYASLGAPYAQRHFGFGLSVIPWLSLSTIFSRTLPFLPSTFTRFNSPTHRFYAISQSLASTRYLGDCCGGCSLLVRAR